MNAYKIKVTFINNEGEEGEITGYVAAANYFEAAAKVEKDIEADNLEIAEMVVTWFDTAPNGVIYPEN